MNGDCRIQLSVATKLNLRLVRAGNCYVSGNRLGLINTRFMRKYEEAIFRITTRKDSEVRSLDQGQRDDGGLPR